LTGASPLICGSGINFNKNPGKMIIITILQMKNLAVSSFR
jgi:hypothetical protein